MKLRLLFILALNSCSHSIHQVHTSGFDPYARMSSGKIVKASAKQQAVMGFVSDTNYVNAAYNKILASCKGGKVTGITTQFSTSHGFFSWTNKILMQGLCLP